ncbi:unnamed protein product [Psylliodes chrysocephalus]|uniref:Centromere protein C n=1 Tax=Psylliodes chrysocephalus TaxID=3402493 RepID=A0A9P0CIN3_9CUCU|nr:unnamed protein product [Psylliodes chrysocephala]
MSRAKNKISKITSPLASSSDSSSGLENDELPNQLKNLINKDDIPRRKKKIWDDQIQPIKFRPSIVQRALIRNVYTSTPSNKNLAKLFFPSDSSYSPIDLIDTEVERKLKQKKYSNTNLISDSSCDESNKNRQDKNTTHTSRLKTQKNKSEAPVGGCLFNDIDKNTSPMRFENKSQTLKKRSDSPENSCLFYDKDISPVRCSNKSQTQKEQSDSPASSSSSDDEDKKILPMRCSNKSQTQKKKSHSLANSCLFEDNDKNVSHSNMSQIDLICRRLRRKSETNKDDMYKFKSLKLLGKMTTSLNGTTKQYSKRADSSEPNKFLKKRVCAGTQRFSKQLLSQNHLSTINSEDDNCRLHESESNKNKSNLIEVKKSSSKFRNSVDLDKNEMAKETAKNSRNNTPLLSKIISRNNSKANFSHQNVTLRKSNIIADRVSTSSKPLSIQINDGTDCELSTKKNVEVVSKIPVLRSRSKSKEKCNKSTKSKMAESICHSQFHKSSIEKVPNASYKVPIENEESKNNNTRPNETSSIIGAKQRKNSFESGAATDISNATKYIDELDCCNIYESVKEGSIVDRFSSGYDHNILENPSIKIPWRYTASSSNIILPNDDCLNEKMPFKQPLLRKSIKPSIKHYSRALSSVMHRSSSNSNKSLNSSSDVVSSGTKDSSFIGHSTTVDNTIIKEKSANERPSDKIEKWLTDIRLSQSKVVSPEKWLTDIRLSQSCLNLQNNRNGNVQTKSDNLNVTNSRTLINTDDKEFTEHNSNDSINEKLSSIVIKKSNVTRKPQNQSETNEENREKSKNSVKKKEKKSRKSLRVLLKNDRKCTVHTKQTSPINKSRKKTQSDSEADEVHCERNEENGESIEENDEATKKYIKKIKLKTRKSLRVLLKKENSEKPQMKNQIKSKTNDKKCERNEKNYETEDCDWDDEISTQFFEKQKHVAEIKPQDNEIRQSTRKRERKSTRPNKKTDKGKSTKSVQEESAEENCDKDDEISTQFFEKQKHVADSLCTNLKKNVQEIKPQDNEISQSPRKNERKSGRSNKKTGKGKSTKSIQEESVEENCDRNHEISTQFVETQKNVTDSLSLNLKETANLQEIKLHDNEVGQSSRKRRRTKTGEFRKRNLEKGKSTMPVQEESVEENCDLNYEIEISTQFVKKQKVVTDSIHVNLKKSDTLQETKPQDNEIVQPSRKVGRQKKTGEEGKSTIPLQEESVNIGNTGRPVRNRRPPRPGMYDTVVIDSCRKLDAQLWNCLPKEDKATSKKNKSTGTKKNNFKKPILNKKKLSYSIATNSAISRNSAVPEHSTIPEHSSIPENSSDFPEGVINPVFNNEENRAASEMYTNLSNNNNCQESNDNQLIKFNDFAMPQTQKPIDHDSGTSTMMDEIVNRKNKKSSILTKGLGIHNKSASRKKVNKNTRSIKSLRNRKPSLEDEYRNNESLGMLSPTLEDTSRNGESLGISDQLIEDEYIELTVNKVLNRLKFVEKTPNFAEMADNLIYSDSLDYGSGKSLIYLEIPPCRHKSPHISKNHDVFYVVIEGHGRIIVTRKYSKIEKLSRFFVPKGVSYLIHNDSKTENMLLVCFRVLT